MTQQEFSFEFYNEVDNLGLVVERALRQEAETQLRALGKGHQDLIGAAVSLEIVAQGQDSPHLYQARVVVYARPENVAAVTKQGDPTNALKTALVGVERQLRDRRDRLRERSQRAPATQTNEALYELTGQELYQRFASDSLPDVWLEVPRDEIAGELMTKEQLSQEDAFYVADQIQAVAQEIVNTPDPSAISSA